MAYFGYTPETGTDTELLVLWRAAFAKVSQHQSYKVGDRELTMADLPEIRATITWLESRVDNASSGPSFNYANMKRAT